MNCAKIFRGIPGGHVDVVKALVHANDPDDNMIIDNDDRDMIWAYFESFVKICIKHLHNGRKPDTIKKNGKDVQIYRKKFFPEIKKLGYYASKCNIDLWK